MGGSASALLDRLGPTASGGDASRNQHNLGRNATQAEEGAQNVTPHISFSDTVGHFFYTHFLVAGERYETPKPENYLFGENSDLDQLGTKPVAFPFVDQIGSNAVRPLVVHANVRRDSVKFVRVEDAQATRSRFGHYRLEFIFDSEKPVSIQIHFHARESDDGQFLYQRRDAIRFSEEWSFGVGCAQHFKSFVFQPESHDMKNMKHESGLFYPLVIALRTSSGPGAQLHTTNCSLEIQSDASLSIKPLRQRLVTRDVSLLIQEVFGLENKDSERSVDESGYECVICMTDVRDTLILPCRHLCLCSGCAETLRYKLNNCPICRSPFRTLLQLRAARRGERNGRFETSLVEALNGPLAASPPPTQMGASLSRSSGRTLGRSSRGSSVAAARRRRAQQQQQQQQQQQPPPPPQQQQLLVSSPETSEHHPAVEEAAQPSMPADRIQQQQSLSETVEIPMPLSSEEEGTEAEEEDDDEDEEEEEDEEGARSGSTTSHTSSDEDEEEDLEDEEDGREGKERRESEGSAIVVNEKL